ncbi:hypothetical protein LPJ64_004709 [Coemansia asiatica]|uniref:DUF202 domain-containing protein n=1 Tax=Coemansia asiatica TaxID=1052880 RepID=A0A9W8CIV3_9FUNG|nr:hypothetical protein LPJ64_004709 [Coemansia asiatica]KAJ2874710.1 hypothetical protein FB639_004073 [Coemansia asiatica]
MNTPYTAYSSPTLNNISIDSRYHRPFEKLRNYHRRVIDNECSMARDQFAVERNFLSWFKLSMAVASSGAVIFRDYDKARKPFQPLKYTRIADISTVYFISLSIVMLGVAMMYLWDVKLRLAKENRPARLFWMLFLGVLGFVGAMSLVIVLALSYANM